MVDVFKYVPRETVEVLENFSKILLKWQSAINLISNNDVERLWERHILDSFQLTKYIKGNEVLDIGSGGGFPAVIIAVSTKHLVHLVESDERKALFLNEVKRNLKLNNMFVHNVRIEHFSLAKRFDNITARGFSSLKELIKISKNLLKENGQCLFMKGESYISEIDDARKFHEFTCSELNNEFHDKGKIIKITDIK